MTSNLNTRAIRLVPEMQQVLEGHPDLVVFNFDYDKVHQDLRKADERSMTEKKLEVRDRASMLPSGLTRHQVGLLKDL